MDIQYYGANCLVVTHKNTKLVIDDNLTELGKKNITKADDVALYTINVEKPPKARLVFEGAGEYEVGDLSIIGIDTKPFMNDDSKLKSTMYKISTSDIDLLILGNIFGELTAEERESVGKIDILVLPVGNNGYTMDAIEALKLIKDLEPKVVIPTHYASSKVNYPVPQDDLDKVLKELAMEPTKVGAKYKIKPADLSEATQLVIIEES